MRRARLGLAMFVSLLVAAPGSANEAFQIDKRDFRKTYKTIVLAPVEADGYLQLTPAVSAMLEQEVTARLEKRGYTVLPSSLLDDLRTEMVGHARAVNSDNAVADAARQAAAREHAYRELWFRHDFDAVATIRIRIFNVPMENDRVEWDGVKQKISYEGRSKKYAANINVSSVAVAIYDSTGEPLFVSYGGLEPIMKRNGEQLDPLPAEQLLLDEKKVRKAAQVAVKPI